jgi:hypothetical protein
MNKIDYFNVTTSDSYECFIINISTTLHSMKMQHFPESKKKKVIDNT